MTEEKNTENKTRMAVWFTPAVIRRMDGWLEEDNCKTRSEFMDISDGNGYCVSEQNEEEDT